MQAVFQDIKNKKQQIVIQLFESHHLPKPKYKPKTTGEKDLSPKVGAQVYIKLKGQNRLVRNEYFQFVVLDK